MVIDEDGSLDKNQGGKLLKQKRNNNNSLKKYHFSRFLQINYK